MNAAIFGLVGVVIGALVTGGVTFFLEARRERAALRAGLRLVGEELKDMLGEVRIIVVMGGWGTPQVRETLGSRISHEQWDRHRDVLAAHLSPSDWRGIAAARDVERLLQSRFDEVRRDTNPSLMLFEGSDRSDLERWQDRLREIVTRIAVLIGEPPPKYELPDVPRRGDRTIRRI